MTTIAKKRRYLCGEKIHGDQFTQNNQHDHSLWIMFGEPHCLKTVQVFKGRMIKFIHRVCSGVIKVNTAVMVTPKYQRICHWRKQNFEQWRICWLVYIIVFFSSYPACCPQNNAAIRNDSLLFLDSRNSLYKKF